MRHSRFLRAASFALLAGCSAALVGCGADSAPFGLPEDEPIPTDLTSAAAVLAAYERAWEEKDYVAMAALLDGEFEYCIRDDDAEDFPWLTADAWARSVELEMAGNMMDENFAGEELPVESIEFDFRILNETIHEDEPFVIADAGVRVLVGPDTGWFSDTRFEIEFRTDDRGFLRLRKLREIRKTSPAPIIESIDSSTWGSIKAKYR